METWVKVVIWWVAFGGTHYLLSSIPVRQRIIERVGAGPFQGIYSLVAFATFIPLNVVYWGDTHGGAWLWDLRSVPAVRTLTIVLSYASWVLIAAAILQPSPASIAASGAKQARGLSRITRHGMFVGVVIWAFVHVLVNGFAADIAYFGGFVIYSIIGMMHQDARKRASEPALAEFYETTSAIPFAAIASGRNKLVVSELPWVGLGFGVIVAGLLYHFHDALFG